MVVPNRHVNGLEQLTQKELLDLVQLTTQMIARLKQSLKPQGFNVGLNLGRAAGAGVPRHLHVHIVPRWKADTNFMPVTADTKVLSESLGSVYQGLKGVRFRK